MAAEDFNFSPIFALLPPNGIAMQKLFMIFLLLLPLSGGLIAQNPESVGDVYFEDAEMEKALEQYNLALEKNPEKAALWVKRGKTKVELLDYVGGLEDLEKAIEINPQAAEPYYVRSLFYRQVMGNFNQADKDLNKAIELDPKGSYLFMRGVFAYEAGRFEKALKDLDAAIATGEKNADLYTYKSAVLSDKGDLEGALEWSKKAIGLDSLNRLAWAVRMKTLLSMIDPDAVCKSQQEALDLKVEAEVVSYLEQSQFCTLTKQEQYTELAGIFYMQGSLSKAIQAYSGALALEPNNYELLLNRGSAAFMLGEMEMAKQDYEKALSMVDKKNVAERMRLLQGLADMLALNDDFAGSIKYCNQMLEIQPDQNRAILGRGFCYRNLKEYGKAQTDFETVMKKEPENHLPYVYRAWNYFDQEKFDLALADANKAVEMKSTDGLGYVILGEAKRSLGQEGYCFDYQMAKTLDIPDAADLLEKYCE